MSTKWFVAGLVSIFLFSGIPLVRAQGSCSEGVCREGTEDHENFFAGRQILFPTAQNHKKKREEKSKSRQKINISKSAGKPKRQKNVDIDHRMLAGELTLLSTLIHFFIGLAFFLSAFLKLCAIEVPRIKRLEKFSSLFLVLGGAIPLFLLFIRLGGADKAFVNLATKPEFLILISIMLFMICAGLSEFMVFREKEGVLWHYSFFAFIFAVGALFLNLHDNRFAFMNHVSIGVGIILYAAGGFFCRLRPSKAVKIISLFLLVVSSLLLMTYSENPRSFVSGSVVLEADAPINK